MHHMYRVLCMLRILCMLRVLRMLGILCMRLMLYMQAYAMFLDMPCMPCIIYTHICYAPYLMRYEYMALAKIPPFCEKLCYVFL